MRSESELNQIAYEIRGCGLRVHRKLGPGCFESFRKDTWVGGQQIARTGHAERLRLRTGGGQQDADPPEDNGMGPEKT